jgi:hypothetical protein
MAERSQRTLGRLIPILESLSPDGGYSALTDFWRTKVFGAGFAKWCIDTVIDYNFNWPLIITVGAQLRHSDPRITLGLYAHVVPQSQRDAVEGLASTLCSGQLLTQRLNADLAPRKSFVS